MAKVNWQDTGDDIPQPGIYLAEIKSAKERRSGNGTNMFEVQLFDPMTGRELCVDYIMLEGKGWKIGREKLLALGVDMTKDDVGEADVVNRLAYVAIVHETRTFEGKDGKPKTVVDAKVDREATSPWCGYWHETQKPEGYEPKDQGAPF